MINGVRRPTLTSATPRFFRPDCRPVPNDPKLLSCTVRPPLQNRLTPWEIVEVKKGLVVENDGDEAASEANPQRRSRYLVVPGTREAKRETQRVLLPADVSKLFFVRALPPVASRTVATPELVLPGGGVLRTHIGIEESTWGGGVAPVSFQVRLLRAEADVLELLLERTLDPADREEDRDWVPLEVPIPDLGDTPFRLVFQTVSRNPNAHHAALPVWGDPTILSPEQEVRRPRRVVLISLDTLRARSMSAYGHDLPTTPLFEKMLEEGTLFENAFTTFTNTLGAHMSMMTGLYPANHRIRAANFTLDAAIPTLAQHMRAAGYETAAFTENALLRATAGFQRGFGRYLENTGLFDGAGDAAGTFRRTLDWTATRPDEPLFLFVHTYEVHHPYRPPDYTRERLPTPPAEKDPAPVRDGDEGAVGDETPLRAYEREIVHLDRLLAEFLAELGAQMEDPGELLVIITSDHGEEFREHGYTVHSQMYDEVMQIPMFLRWPGHIPGDLRIATPVSLVDLVPTILDLVGAPTPGVDGTSLVPLMAGTALERTTVFGQAARGNANGRKSRYVARSSTGKCMVRDDPGGDGWSECYDLIADPAEKTPLPPDHSPELSALHARAIEYRAQAARQIAGEKAEKELAEDDEADPARRDKLRMLGYIE